MVIFNANQTNNHLRSTILSNEHTINKYLPIKTPVNKIRISYSYTEMMINYFISIRILYFLYTQNISFLILIYGTISKFFYYFLEAILDFSQAKRWKLFKQKQFRKRILFCQTVYIFINFKQELFG